MRVLVSVILLVLALRASAADRPNVLFIASDDMRPQLRCYGDPTVKSPNIDRLAAQGMLFERSFVQQALCSPSRISMLSGRHPATTQIFEIGRPLRATLPNIITLPQHFKNNGYHTRSMGKIYHVGIDDDASWTIPAWHSKKPRNGPAGSAAQEARRQDYKARGVTPPAKGEGSINYAAPAFDSVNCADDDLLDGDTARNAIAQLKEHAKTPGQPFFLAVGFANPHVPWVSPKKYWDLYDPAKIPLATNEFLPKDAPGFAATSGRDFLWYGNVPRTAELPEPFKRQCLHGYLAAISYVDAQVGRLISTLKETGLDKNTIVVFWSDHGYYMGEHTWWGAKHNNYEGATHNAFIISVPGMKQAGRKTQSIVQSVDIAPTLTELCGLPKNTGFEGRSLKPVLDDPNVDVNDAAFSWYPKAGWLGVAMRMDKWRYVEWTKSGEDPVQELYNMVQDPENDQNVAAKPEHQKILEILHKRLRERFPVQELKDPAAAKGAQPGKKGK
ncbi:MAG: sulfatase [Verrucomicrobiales bacterium]|nr:sulfatase [Verrucomicrobiales bacterium]